MKNKEILNYPLNQLYFYLTDGCNLHCKHCWISPSKIKSNFNFLSTTILTNIIREALPLGLKSVKLTGGEPLLHPEILEIFRIIKNFDLALTIETNGILLTKEIASKIKEFKKLFIAISLDSPCSDTHEQIRGLKGSFDKTLEGIKNLTDLNIFPQLIMTLMKDNINQIEQMIKMAHSLKAGSLKFNILQPTEGGQELHRNNEAIAVDKLILIGKKIDTVFAKQSKIKLHFDYPVAFRSLSNMFGDKGNGCSTCGIFSILGVLSDGSYALCGIGKTIKELVFGNAKNSPLKNIWEKNDILNSLRTGLPYKLEGICKKCVMSSKCLGGCIAQNYYKNHNLFSPFWFCEEANKLGVFPDSRIKKAKNFI